MDESVRPEYIIYPWEREGGSALCIPDKPLSLIIRNGIPAPGNCSIGSLRLLKHKKRV